MHLLYTDQCNLNCIHCFSKMGLHEKNSEMTFAEKVSILDEMKRIGICELLIGGGEPFIIADIFDFIKECNERSIVVKIFTNGLLIGNSNFSHVLNAKIAYLAISVDGTSPEEYKSVRGIDGLSTVKDNIQKLKAADCEYEILICATINRFNCNNPEGFLRFMTETKADRLKIRGTKPNGNILNNRDVMVDPLTYKRFLCEIQKLYLKKYNGQFKLDLTWGDFRLNYDDQTQALIVQSVDLPYENYGCVAAKTAMSIDSFGIGMPCGFLPESLQSRDSVIEKSILEVWHKNSAFQYLRSLTANEVCANCELYVVCRGGCISRIVFDGQAPNGLDPWCPKKFFPIYI